jgi:hypothetical protein
MGPLTSEQNKIFKHIAKHIIRPPASVRTELVVDNKTRSVRVSPSRNYEGHKHRHCCHPRRQTNPLFIKLYRRRPCQRGSRQEKPTGRYFSFLEIETFWASIDWEKNQLVLKRPNPPRVSLFEWLAGRTSFGGEAGISCAPLSCWACVDSIELSQVCRYFPPSLLDVLNENSEFDVGISIWAISISVFGPERLLLQLEL